MRENYRLYHLKNSISNEKRSYELCSEKLEFLRMRHDETDDASKKFDLKKQVERLDEDLEKSSSKIEDLESEIEKLELGYEDSSTEKKVFESYATQDLKDPSSENEALNIEKPIRKRNKVDSYTVPEESQTTIFEVKNLFLNSNKIENILLYVSTFFPNLTPYEFNQVVSSLLKDKFTDVTISSKIITEKGKTCEIESYEKKSLLEIWKESLGEPDKYLRKCHLKALKSEKSVVIDFDTPHLREEMKKYLREDQSLYLDHLLEQTQFFIFHPYIEVAKGGIEILIDAMLTHPTVYEENWIFNLIQALTIEENWKINPALDLEQQIQKYLQELERQARIEIIFIRISDLIYFMMEYDILQFKAKLLLDKLMYYRRYDAVLAIVNNLDNVQGFDAFHWLKQLIDNGDEETRLKTYKFLYGQLKRSGYKIYEKLGKIQSWLPQKNREPNKYSSSNKAALSILVDYCSDTISKFPEKDYGCYPSKYSLFRPFQKGKVEDKLKLIISWLLYPSSDRDLAIQSVLNENLNAMEFLGSIIAEWFIIFCGLENDEPPAESREAIDIMLQQLIAHSSKSQQKELSQFWTDFADYLLSVINRHPESSDPEVRKNKRRLTRRRNLFRQLNKQFKAHQKSA